MTVPNIGDLFKEGSIGQQLFIWGLLSNVVQTLTAPAMNELGWLVNELQQTVLLSPPDAASAVVRNFIAQGDAQDMATRQGVSPGDFATMIHLAGDAPAPEQLAAALRRKIIPQGGTGADSTSFVQGIAEGRLADKWAPVIQALAQIWPTPMDAIRASVQGFYTDAAGAAAYEQFGGAPEFYNLLHYINGDAPSPGQLLELWNRGIIPEDSGDPNVPGYTQGIRQGNLRNMWLDAYKELRVYYPPPRTITALHKEGVLTDTQAADYLAKAGMQPDLITAYLQSGTTTATAKAKELTEADVIKLYEAHVLDQVATVHLLEALGYSQDNADYLTKLADLRVSIAAVAAAVTRVRTLYSTRKITEAGAREALASLQVPADQIGAIITEWNILRGVTVKQLTEAQIVDAWEYKLVSDAEAISELQSIGYTARDAWLLLSIKNKGAIDTSPPPAAAGVGVIP